MLSPQQITTLKASATNPGGTTTGGFNAPQNAPMNEEQFNQWSGASPSNDKGVVSKVGNFFEKLGENTTNALVGSEKSAAEEFSKGTVAGGVHGAARTLEAGGHAFGAAVEPVLSPIVSAITKIADPTNYVGPKGIEALNKVNDFFDAHPDAKKFILQDMPTFLNTAGTMVGMVKAPQIEQTAAATAGKIKSALTPETTPEAVTTPAEKISVGKTPEQAAMDRMALSEKIAPKPTKTVAKTAMQQGRLIPGKEPGIFTEGTPTKIAASPQQAKSVMTIDRLIPEHATMDEPSLYTALDSKIGEISGKLEPEMQKVPIDRKTLESINTRNSSLKKSLIDEAPATEEKNVAKRQQQFEAFLKKSGSSNMKDLWDTAKAYDASIPDRVKSANVNSPESLQLQKNEWLQRRAVLRDAIKSSSNGLGEASKKAFSDMTDLFSAQDGLLSKAEVKGAAPSKISEFSKTTTGKVTKAALKTAGVGAGIHLIP